MRAALLVLGLLLTGYAKDLASSVDYCAADKACGNLEDSTELQRWACLGRQLYAPLAPTKLKKTHFVEHDCGGVGWGNSIRGLFNAAGIAAVTGRRLIVTHSAFNRVFLPPNDSMVGWDFGLSGVESGSRHKLGPNSVEAYNLRQYFDFELHGRAPNRFAEWANSVKESPQDNTYTKPVLVAGICGGEREILTTGGCLTRILPKFIGCVDDDFSGRGGTYFGDNMLSIPFFYTLFQRPGPMMKEALDLIRERLGLGPEGSESGVDEEKPPTPGAWGLRTPGTYILALHFRNIPIGFEPLSLELHEKRSLDYRRTVLQGFWVHAVRAAKAAKEIATCRKQQLLIYFATDDVKNLRPEAESRLGEYGRLVFGLTEQEVGHMSPQWSRNDLDKLSHIEQKLEKGVREVEVDTHIHGKTTLMIDSHVAQVDRSDLAAELHGTMAIVEWWILAHAHWLVGHSGTSFSETASGVGLGPLGVMERFDMVHSESHFTTSLRRDWAGPDMCAVVRSADQKHEKACPNNFPSA